MKERLRNTTIDEDIKYLRSLTAKIVSSSVSDDEILIQKVINYNDSNKRRCFVCQCENDSDDCINLCENCKKKVL